MSDVSPEAREAAEAIAKTERWSEDVRSSVIARHTEVLAPFFTRALDAQTKELEQAKREATRLAEIIWRAEYKDDAPDWKPLDSVAGVISQIDNMFAGIRQQRDTLRWELARLREENERLTRERDLYLGVIQYVCKTLECVDCGAAPPQELARRAAKRIATLERQAEEMRYLLEGTVYMGSWDLKQQGEWERERDKHLAATAATSEGGSEG